MMRAAHMVDGYLAERHQAVVTPHTVRHLLTFIQQALPGRNRYDTLITR